MGARTDQADSPSSTLSAALLTHVGFALLVGLVIGVIAATTGSISALGAIGIVFGVAIGLVGMVAVPALLRLEW